MKSPNRSKSYKYCFVPSERPEDGETPNLRRMVEENEVDTDDKLGLFTIELGQTPNAPLVVLVREDVAQRCLGKKLGGTKIVAEHKHYRMGLSFHSRGGVWRAVPRTSHNPQPLDYWRIYLYKMADVQQINRDVDALVAHVEQIPATPKVKINWHLVGGENANTVAREKRDVDDVEDQPADSPAHTPTTIVANVYTPPVPAPPTH